MADQQTDVLRSAAFAALVQALCVAAEPPPAPSDRGEYLRARERATYGDAPVDDAVQSSSSRRAASSAPGSSSSCCGSRRRPIGSSRWARRAGCGRSQPTSWRARLARLAAMLRSAQYVLWLAGRRLGRRSGARLLVVLGIAAGAALLVGVQVATTVAQDRALAQAIERIPEGSRSVRTAWFGVPGANGDPQPALDASVRQALAGVDLPRGTAVVLLRETTIAGKFASLGGIEGLGRWVASAPADCRAQCRPERCEVLRLRGAGRLPQPEGLRLVEVGEATLPSRELMGDFLAPTDNALTNAEVSPAFAAAAGYHRPPPPPLFLAEGVRTLAASPALARVYRSYAWVSPLREGQPRLWEVDRLAADVTRARSELQAETISFDLIAPLDELRDAQDASRRAGHRLALVGGQAAVLVFAFAILAAATLRGDLHAARRRLAWHGGRSWQAALLTGVETAGPRARRDAARVRRRRGRRRARREAGGDTPVGRAGGERRRRPDARARSGDPRRCRGRARCGRNPHVAAARAEAFLGAGRRGGRRAPGRRGRRLPGRATAT